MTRSRELAELASAYDGGSLSFRNRIINGDMRIDQRNAGASVTPTNGQYTLDRFRFFVSQSSKLTTQQNQGSVTSAVGFPKYLGVTSSSAYSVGSADYFTLCQNFESSNVSDFAWGTASAVTVTLSFWVRSSLTGTFGGVVRNWSSTRSYPFTYTVNSANTWEQKTVTIPGDTSGTWVMDGSNGGAIELHFGLGVGSTYSGTAGSWAGANYLSATGATSVVGTNGATFYITGVQLEAGPVATPFERRPYGTELQLCQRYYQTFSAINYTTFHYASSAYAAVILPVTMRTAPTVTSQDTSGSYYEAGAAYSWSSPSLSGYSSKSISMQFAVSGGTNGYAGTAYFGVKLEAEL